MVKTILAFTTVAATAAAVGFAADNNNLKTINRNFETQVEVMETARDEALASMNEYRLALTQKAVDLDEKTALLAEKETLLAEKEALISAKNARIAELEEELANNGSLSEEQLANYEAQITSLQNQKATLTSEKETLQSEVNTLTAQVAELSTQIETLQARITELESNQTQTAIPVTSASKFRIEDGYITQVKGSGMTDVIFPSTYSLDSSGNAIDGTDFTIKGLRSSIFFNDSNLQSVVLPDTFTKIGRDCFRSCKNIKYNEYDNGCYIGSETNPYMFLATVKSTDITSIIIHPDTKIIGDAFRSCTALTEVTIPEGVIALEDYAFYGCSALTTLSLPNTLERVGRNCFGANSLTYTEYNNGKYLGNTSNPHMVLVMPIDSTTTSFVAHVNTKIVGGCPGNGFRSGSFTSITLPDGLLSIADYTFQESNALTTINLGNSIKYIGENAFMNAGLTSVTIPATAVDLYRAFYRCQSLTDVTIAEGVEFNIDNTFYSCTALTNINYTRENELKGFGSYSYKDGVLTILSMSDLDNKPIWAIDNLSIFVKEVKFACQPTHISKSSFLRLSNVESITIPNSVTRLQTGIFSQCSKLINITLPDNLSVIDYNALSDLNSAVYSEYNNGKYLGSASNPYLVLCDIVDTTITEFATLDTTKFILDSAFSGCTALTSVSLSPGLLSIGNVAFMNCSSLKEVTIPASVTRICITAFYGCALTTLTMETNIPPVLFAGNYAGNYVTATTINIPAGSLELYQMAENWSENAAKFVEVSEG